MLVKRVVIAEDMEVAGSVVKAEYRSVVGSPPHPIYEKGPILFARYNSAVVQNSPSDPVLAVH